MTRDQHRMRPPVSRRRRVSRRRNRVAARAMRFVAVGMALGLTACDAMASPSSLSVRPAPQLTSPQTTAALSFLTEVYGDSGPLLDQRLQTMLANGASLHPPLTGRERELVAGRPVAYFAIPDEAAVAECYPQSSDPDAAATLRTLGVTPGSRAWRIGMPEFDQSGGCWSHGRPRLAGMSDTEAYAAWSRFYLDAKGLRPYLEQSAVQRGYKWMSVCVYAFCPQYAFDLGSDAVLLERNIDEVSAISPGLAMVRGAARQHEDRDWGIDISTYRYWNGGPTSFDDNGRLVTGWSPSMFERTMFASYMAGADIILNEAANYGSGAADRGRNPLGAVVGDFAEFSTLRHPDRGVPEVPMALLQDHFSGFEPRFGEFDQVSRKWYGQTAFTAGDKMLSGLLDTAYPGHRRWGTITNAPWRVVDADGTLDVHATQSAFRRALATPGADPRTWEPMGNTRWGESLDVITDHARLDTLLRYRVVVLTTSGAISDGLLADLSEYARRGGTVVVNASQLPPGPNALAGVEVSDQRRSASSVTWSDGTRIPEDRFDYIAVQRGSDTEDVATTTGGDPAIVRHPLGAGTVYLTTADHLLDADGTKLLGSGTRLLDELHAAVATATVEGPPLQYLVNTVGASTVVTLINTDVGGATWRGRVRFKTPASDASVQEWRSDSPVPSSVADGDVVVDASVPPFGVRIYAMQPGRP